MGDLTLVFNHMVERLRHGRQELDAVNEKLQAMKDDGTLTTIYQKYFHTDPPDSVLNGTTDNPG